MDNYKSIDYTIPQWLIESRVRRRKREKEVQRSRRNLVIRVVLGWAVLLGFMAFLFFIAFTAKTELSYIAPAPVYASIETAPVYKTVDATVTAYTSSVDETDDTPFITASGAQTGHGIVACPPKYEFGTQIEIKGREYTCEDRMNARYRDEERFDIWVETKAEAYQWGVREVEVTIL